MVLKVLLSHIVNLRVLPLFVTSGNGPSGDNMSGACVIGVCLSSVRPLPCRSQMQTYLLFFDSLLLQLS